MFSQKDLVIATAVLMMLLTFETCFGQDVIKKEYRIEEESGPGIFVGHAGKDTGLLPRMRKDVNTLMFQPFAQGNEYISYFSANSSTGIIRTARNIDRETLCPGLPLCFVKLSIAVYTSTTTSESPTLLNILEIMIRIVDVNDNSPTFPSPVVTLPVPENLDLNYQIETSVATDADEDGANSRITYRLVPSSDTFELSTVRTIDGVEDLVITIKQVLDREEKGLYRLLVIATDLGDEPKSGSMLINIEVADMNDNAPVFGRLSYSVKILENSDVSIPVLVVAASDIDDGDNARLTYSLSFQVSQEIRDTFKVESNTGKVFSRKQLDYETKHAYQFSVVVSDSGTPTRSHFAYVTINVLDVNDNTPLIQINPAPGGDTVIEHGSLGKFLAYIKVTDADSRAYGQVSCDIFDSSFVLELVDAASLGIYKIKLIKTLDREEAPTRDVVITCQDADVRPMTSSASFTVVIEDINDNAPTFLEDSMFGSVMENGNTNVYVMQVLAVDPDVGENSRLTFAITSEGDEPCFSINENTGAILTTRTLDREVRGQYFLEVTVSDHGMYSLASTATVTIRVLDENDSPPRFRKQAFFSSVMENLPAGALVGNPSAYDLDSHENAIFVFSITDEGTGFGDGSSFDIDPNTGLIKSVASFNREQKSVYKFRVKVADPNIFSFYDIANVTVSIEDDNDHAPFVVNPPPTGRIFRCPFNTTVGETITTFVATDGDDPATVIIMFHIQKTSPNPQKWPLFSIDPYSGKLRLARQIRPNDVAAHTLEVVVRDGPGPSSQSSVVSVSIIVEEGSEEAMRDFINGSKTNIVIVIIIIAVTLVLVCIIVAIICLIRRVDKKRRPQLPCGLTNVNNKMYQAAKWVSTVSVTKDMGQEEIASILEVTEETKKKKKKEVSFSLEDNDAAGSPETIESFGNIFASSMTATQRIDGLSFHLNTHQGDFIVMNGMTTPDYSLHLYDVSTPSANQQDIQQYMEVRHADDRYSDASSGDTGTSDSGRGGSEDEGHGHTSSSGDREIQKASAGSSLNRGHNGTLKNSNNKNNNDNSQKRLIQLDPSTKDSEEVPGSPTPLLSNKERQAIGSCYLGCSDTFPIRRSPTSENSSLSPLEKTASVSRRQHRYKSEQSKSDLGEDGVCHGRRTDPQQHHPLLQTFSSPNSSGISVCNSNPTRRRNTDMGASWRQAACEYTHTDDISTADSGASTTADPSDALNLDMLV